jgi:hypothetical protein
MSTKARLLYCKSHVSIHPTQFNKDNISGYLALVEADSISPSAIKLDSEGNVGNAPVGKTGKEVIVTWVPDEVLQRMDLEDREGYKKVEERSSGSQDAEDDGEGHWDLVPIMVNGRLCVCLDPAAQRREVCLLGAGLWLV